MTAAPTPDRDAEMLARLAEMDFSAVEHVHAQLMAASAPDEVADLGRAYQRAARSLRQTLALKAKLVRDAEAARRADEGPRGRTPGDEAAQLLARRIDARAAQLDDAVDRVIRATYPQDARRRAVVQDRFYVELEDWVTAERFALDPLDDHVADVCRALALPPEVAARWRDLPACQDDHPGAHGPPAPAAPAPDTG